MLTQRGRDVRVVNPLWTNRQRAFYGQDKDDSIDGRSIAAVVLRPHHERPWRAISARWFRQFVRPREVFKISAARAPGSAGQRALPHTLALELKAELIRQLCDEGLAIHNRIRRLERLLREQLLPATGQTVATIPGISTILAATIIGETASIAPARNSTCGRERHKAHRDCNRRLKRAFFLAARAAVLHDLLAKTYRERCKSRGLSYEEGLKRVARRMSDLVYALLKSGKRYDRSLIEQAIEKRREQMAHVAIGHAKEPCSLPTQTA